MKLYFIHKKDAVRNNKTKTPSLRTRAIRHIYEKYKGAMKENKSKIITRPYIEVEQSILRMNPTLSLNLVIRLALYFY